MDFQLPIYLDHNASTPVDKRVLDEMLPYFTNKYGNPSSVDHFHGAEASKAVEVARENVANLVNCEPSEVIFTSGASEADNLAILGYARANSEKKHIITCSTEHKAVLRSVELLSSQGYEATILPVDSDGLINPTELERSLRNDTLLVSIMIANNEIGTIAPIQELVKITHETGALFHTDAAQAVGHIDVDVKSLDVDMLSLSGHKMYGPKGIGALILRKRRPRIKLTPIIYGGGHERGFRSGTLNVPGIVGLGKASAIAIEQGLEDRKRVENLRDHFVNVVENSLESVEINGHRKKRLPHNTNLYIEGVQNKALQYALRKELAFSTGSACETDAVEYSHVIQALGYEKERSASSIRIGFGRFTKEDEAEFAASRITEESTRLRKLN